MAPRCCNVVAPKPGASAKCDPDSDEEMEPESKLAKRREKKLSPMVILSDPSNMDMSGPKVKLDKGKGRGK